MPKQQHTCHAIQCDSPCPPEWLFCKPHWEMLSKELQNDVLSNYVPGQCIDHTKITKFWLKAAANAKAYVAIAEGIWHKHDAEAYLSKYSRFLKKR